jgi:hypothetical protein
MSFQWIFDNAADISMVRRPIVSQTTSRDQRIRTVSRGGNIWRFTITMPKGLRWQENNAYIGAVDDYNILKTDYVNMSRAAFNYIMGYKGQITNNLSNIQFQGLTGSDIATLTGISNSGLSDNSYLFRAGDFIQPTTPGSSNGTTNPNQLGRVYSIAQDYKVTDLPLNTDNTRGSTLNVRLNRPYLGELGTSTCNTNIGSQVVWKVICTSCPTWTINPGGLVSWSGPFQFAESLL